MILRTKIPINDIEKIQMFLVNKGYPLNTNNWWFENDRTERGYYDIYFNNPEVDGVNPFFSKRVSASLEPYSVVMKITGLFTAKFWRIAW